MLCAVCTHLHINFINQNHMVVGGNPVECRNNAQINHFIQQNCNHLSQPLCSRHSHHSHFGCIWNAPKSLSIIVHTPYCGSCSNWPRYSHICRILIHMRYEFTQMDSHRGVQHQPQLAHLIKMFKFQLGQTQRASSTRKWSGSEYFLTHPILATNLIAAAVADFHPNHPSIHCPGIIVLINLPQPHSNPTDSCNRPWGRQHHNHP